VGVIMDSSYRVIARVRPWGGFGADLHDFILTSRGTALLLVYERVPWDLSSIGGPVNGTVLNGIIQEVDVETGRLLFQWRSLDHVPLVESWVRVQPTRRTRVDYFHLNSVQEQADGDLLISARHTNGVYMIARDTGEVVWRLGGSASDFTGAGTDFKGQHDARTMRNGHVLIFDNGAPPDPERESRAIEVALDVNSRTARLVQEYRHPTAPVSNSQGGSQPLPNGNVFVGWGGRSPHFSEFTPDGRLVFDARFVPNFTISYRAYRMRWAGRPAEPPVAVARRDRGGRMTVYASWNGATRAVKWRVLAGRRPDDLEAVARVRKTGFETAIPLRKARRYVTVEALGPAGSVLRRSELAELERR
jgi:hypothetical protein